MMMKHLQQVFGEGQKLVVEARGAAGSFAQRGPAGHHQQGKIDEAQGHPHRRHNESQRQHAQQQHLVPGQHPRPGRGAVRINQRGPGQLQRHEQQQQGQRLNEQAVQLFFRYTGRVALGEGKEQLAQQA